MGNVYKDKGENDIKTLKLFVEKWQKIGEVSKSKIKIVGLRPGDKTYETLITREEMATAKSFSGYYVIKKKITNKNSSKIYPEYDSNSTKQLNNKGLEKLILSLPEIKKAINF